MAIKELSICLLVLVIALTQGKLIVSRYPGQALKATAHKRNDEYFQGKSKRGYYWIRQDSTTDGCKFKSYAPNGPIASVGDIKAPQATLNAKGILKGVLAGPMKKLGKVAAVAMHASKFVGSIAKNCPALGPALGVFSAVMGLVNGPEPSAQDILNKCNEALAELTDEVNKKMKEMENYVDAQIAATEKKLIQAEFKTCFNLWTECVKEATPELSNRCQTDSARHVVSRRDKFAVEADKLNGGITMKEVRRLEAYMLAFRDYANLVVMQLTTLVNYYCLLKKGGANGPHNCQRYANDLISQATYLSNYAEKAVAAIKTAHWGKNKMGPCPDTLKCTCKDVNEGWLVKVHTANNCGCTCEMMNANKKQYCTVRFHIRTDGKGVYSKKNYPDISGNTNFKTAQEKYGKMMEEKFAKDYQIKNHQVMDKYYNIEILDFVKEWRQAIDMAKVAKTKNPKLDAQPVLDEGFSPEYLTRLARTGYTYSDLLRFHESNVKDAQESTKEDNFTEVEYSQHVADESEDESNVAEFVRYQQ